MSRTPKQERHRIMREMDARSRLWAKLKIELDEAAGRHGNTVAELQRAVQEYQAATDIVGSRAALADRINRLTGLAERQAAAIAGTEADTTTSGFEPRLLALAVSDASSA